MTKSTSKYTKYNCSVLCNRARSCADASRVRARQGDLKKHTVANMEDHVHRDERLPMLLDRLKETGMKTFLLTNSEFWYTEAIMSYLFNFEGVSWPLSIRF